MSVSVEVQPRPHEDAESGYGGSAHAIQYHYDVSREFYRLWLDETMTYSCALWEDGDDLARAQHRKIDYHLAQARAAHARTVLDVGCGWGALLRAAANCAMVERVVGLTLSPDQAAFVRSLGLRNTDVRLESWTAHEPIAPYDAIVSVGAFEHFAKPEDSVADKIAVYRDFFRRCHAWLSVDGRLSLQTIAFGSMKREEASAFINNEIFPASDLPRLGEIAEAADGILEIVQVRNDRLHYAKTFEVWAQNLRAHRDAAIDRVGEDVVKRYERYLKQSSMGFYMGKLALYRVTLRPISARWATMAVA
ncbi:cyclopropane-fatty-acyl-phospholipid synthase family protein [Aquabacterium sp. A7-Y]|uniref:SAM-dependent methyltransferase n=1 Tax=Aquabacterium sp. A7-Y TaxID=1349605 RepID=UPI00223D177A|nr:cyclopropane-fatty-acyl-phospholipid synthase family protein [Aquabacterium sp. A7-Y]MCW7541681.1 cyclopropane-fatty-acyl-phospholipid synthase family protein [Aquabacterium sp. A7-Y]